MNLRIPVLLAVAAFAACAKGAPSIESGSEVKMHYTLKVDGQVVDSSAGGEPLGYTHGTGHLVPGLETKMLGRKAGEKFEVTVAAKDAYGERNPDGLRQVTWAAFGGKKEGLKVGDMVSGQANGRPFQAKVAEIGKTGPTIDLNHPLAGKTLDFAIEVVEIKAGAKAG
ncbi:MAG: peptidylprolyl isomerase [Elusimicrobia bacterium]|nr:peptidylprolyl isomerase [Elusimicrobiota bacterium]